MARRLTLFVLIAMIAGVAVGYGLNVSGVPAKSYTEVFGVVTDVFLRLIKMVIGPLVFSTLVVGVAHMEDGASVGRVGVKTLGWFVSASLVSLLLGLGMVHLLAPGEGLNLTLPAAGAKSDITVQAFTLKDFITHLVPTSIAQALANNEILQIVVFSIFVGLAVNSVSDRAPQVMAFAEQVSRVMIAMTGFVMMFAPFAVFAAIANTVASQGLGVLAGYARFVGGFYLSLSLLWTLLIAAGFVIVGPRILRLAGLMRAPALLAFSTASSEAAFPRTLEGLREFGVPDRIAGFVLPLGYSFNLDGSMMYCTFATLFIAQAYHSPLTLGQQITMLLVLMITSKGMAGVPRASLVVIAATLTLFRLPEAGLLLILAVDHLLDMGRSATNVIGNAVAAAVVARWEREPVS
jgi:Na+/H+-dicarboxylate symporter